MNTSPEIAEMAYEIADGCARSDIECYCPSVYVMWYDTGAVATEDRELVALSLRYLDARGLVKHHPDRPELVNFG